MRPSAVPPASKNRAPARRRASSGRTFADDGRGAVVIEYIGLVGLVAIVSIAGFLTAGVALVDSFETTRAMFLCPLP